MVYYYIDANTESDGILLYDILLIEPDVSKT